MACCFIVIPPCLSVMLVLLFFRQCSECASSSSEEETKPSDVDKNAPRRLREKVLIREPMKYTPYVKEKKKKVTPTTFCIMS